AGCSTPDATRSPHRPRGRPTPDDPEDWKSVTQGDATKKVQLTDVDRFKRSIREEVDAAEKDGRLLKDQADALRERLDKVGGAAKEKNKLKDPAKEKAALKGLMKIRAELPPRPVDPVSKPVKKPDTGQAK